MPIRSPLCWTAKPGIESPRKKSVRAAALEVQPAAFTPKPAFRDLMSKPPIPRLFRLLILKPFPFRAGL